MVGVFNPHAKSYPQLIHRLLVRRGRVAGKSHAMPYAHEVQRQLAREKCVPTRGWRGTPIAVFGLCGESVAMIQPSDPTLA